MRSSLNPIGENVVPPKAEFIEALVTHALNAGEEFHIDKSGTVRAGKVVCGRLQIPGTKPPTQNPCVSVASNINVMHFDGKRWTLQYDGTSIELPHSVGLRYIEELVSHPNQEISATDLVLKAHGEPADIMMERDLLEGDVATVEVGCSDAGDAVKRVATDEVENEILPEIDRHWVLKKLEVLRGELAAFESRGKAIQALQTKEDITALEAYLRKCGWGTHVALFPGRAENDRKSVVIAIKRSIENIAKRHPALAQYLTASIRAKSLCCYKPKAETTWVCSGLSPSCSASLNEGE